ncbi:MAG: glycosyltransferase [Bacteroidales bacterium]|jgi:glycosyltransferase involved in cell wall biosynthesis
MINEGISVAVCCYNSEKRLPHTLKHLFNQKVDLNFKWEIIIINNNSSDNTKEAALKSYKDSGGNIPFSVVYEFRQGLIFAREKAFEAAKYNFVCFVDDDNYLDENYIKTAFDIMSKNSEIAVLGGYSEPIAEIDFPEWFSKFKNAYAIGKQNTFSGDITKIKGYVYGAGFIVNKKCWNYIKAKGFRCFTTGRKGKSFSSGEDVEICIAMQIAGYKIWYDENLKLKHFTPNERLTATYLKKFYKGNGKTYPLLNIYKYYLYYDTHPSEYLKLPLWFDRFLFMLKDFQKYFNFFLFKNKLSIEHFEAVEYFEELKSLLKINFRLKKHYSEILELKRNLQRK